ncbi:MAG: alpha/beta fold hydrolase [Gemmatimonadales bacterium]
MSETVSVRRGGDGAPVLVLIHGLGAVGEVWNGLLALVAERWPGRWVVPDLPGHGGSAPLERYSFEAMATSVARAVPKHEPLVLLGHSLGGVIALTLASGRFAVSASAAIGLGIKVTWSDEDLAKVRALAGRANPVYPRRREAAERYLKVAGLIGLLEPELVGDSAVREREGGWSTAFDPGAFGVGAPDMPALLSAARAPVTLAAGERDPMSRLDELARLVPEPVILPGLGHNAHVEDPAAIWSLVERAIA